MFTTFIRTIIMYFFVVLTLRLLGKRQIGELEPSELVVTIVISEVAAMPIQDTSESLVSSLVVSAIYIADNGGNCILLNVPGLNRAINIDDNFAILEELSVLSLLKSLTSCAVSDLGVTVVVTVKNYAGVENLPSVCLVSGKLINGGLSLSVSKDLATAVNGTLVVGNE